MAKMNNKSPIKPYKKSCFATTIKIIIKSINKTATFTHNYPNNYL